MNMGVRDPEGHCKNKEKILELIMETLLFFLHHIQLQPAICPVHLMSTSVGGSRQPTTTLTG